MDKDAEVRLSKEIDSIFRELVLIIFNLEIEAARLTEPNGIRVIAESLKCIADSGELKMGKLVEELLKEKQAAKD